jgi:hypothetical protein
VTFGGVSLGQPRPSRRVGGGSVSTRGPSDCRDHDGRRVARVDHRIRRVRWGPPSVAALVPYFAGTDWERIG